MVNIMLTIVFTVMILLSSVYSYIDAQQLPIPQLQTCKNQYVGGKATGFIASRKDESHTGEFGIAVDVRCRQGQIERGIGTLSIDAFNLNDTQVRHRISVDHLDQLTSVGKAATPTVFLSGTCTVDREDVPGCRFWLMLVDNGSNMTEAPDIIGFLVIDGTGKRIAYGTGTLKAGEIQIVENE